MIAMLLKMSGITLLYVLVTMLLWLRLRGKKVTLFQKVGVGVLYGICSILSTHFGVDYGDLILNVRDIGPLAAGLFFDPMSGILAGLIGGIERYIAGTYWGVGSYTRIACSVSTCLAGFLAAGLHLFVFKKKKPSETFAFFMGAVMEVFHMYVVFITHRDDMARAFYVVKTCSVPMITFTGIGLAMSSMMIRVLSGEWRNPFRRLGKDEIPVSRKFQFWLFAVSVAILLTNLCFTYLLQTQKAIQDGRETIRDVAGDIEDTYEKIAATKKGVQALAEATVEKNAMAIARTVDEAVDGTPDEALLEEMRDMFGLAAVAYIPSDGSEAIKAGNSPLYTALLADVVNGEAENAVTRLSDYRIVAGAACEGGTIQAVIDTDEMLSAVNASGLDDALSYFHVGSEGTFDIMPNSGIITAGTHKGRTLQDKQLKAVLDQEPETFFNAAPFGGEDSLCMTRRLDAGTTLLLALPISEVYYARDMQLYETVMADIILFAVIYVLISMLVQQIVVKNLDLVNQSLGRITDGDLDEVVDVRDSSEFASLSNDINQTVNVLKQYIDAAEKRIEQELEFAFTIQDSSLPKNFTFPRNDFALYATMDPAKEVGGDFYDFFFVGPNRLAMVIADVSGKGIPAALFMMRGKTAIRSLAETGSAPSEILYKANNTLCEGNDAEMFITAWIGIIDLSTGLMRCANAGHEYPALMRAGGEYELFKDRHGLALAAMEGVRYKEYEIQINPGDRLFVYTDGVPEAIDTNVEQYGTDRMLAILNASRDMDMQSLLPAVRKDISDFVGAADQFDDITMLGFAFFGETKGGDDHDGMDV